MEHILVLSLQRKESNLTGIARALLQPTSYVHMTMTCDMWFMYVHSGWEGSANDSRVFKEAIKDLKHGFP